MSRRSLRLDEGLLDRSLPHSSASFSVGGGSWRSSRSSKSRRSQQLSVSCSESLLLDSPRRPPLPSLLLDSPRRPPAPSLLLDSPRRPPAPSLHSVASDASLLSSLLDDSSAQEATLVDSFWGLDQDLDQDLDPTDSTVLPADCTLIGSEGTGDTHLVQTLSRVTCRDQRDESSPGPPETSTVYCRDRSRKIHTGLLGSMWTTLLSLTTHLLLHTHHLTAGPRGVMDLKETPTPLCDDCQERQPSSSSSSSSSSWSSVTCCLLGLMWSAAVFTGKTAADVYRWLNRRWRHMTSSFVLTQFPLSLLLVLLLVLLPLLLLLLSVCCFSPAEWTTVVSDVPGLTSPHSQPAGGAMQESKEVQPYQEQEEVQPYQEQEEVQPYQEQEEVQPYQEQEEVLYSPPSGGAGQEEDSAALREQSVAAGGPVAASGSVAAAESWLRVERLEQSLALLWQQVEAGGRRAEQRHTELLQLYSELQQQLVSGQTHRQEVELWVSALVDQQLEHSRTPVDQDRRLGGPQGDTSRLDQLELQLHTLSARTETLQEVQRRREVSPSSSTLPAAVSGAVEHQSHDALRAEVERLEAALEDVRRDVQGLSECQDKIQQTTSEQVSAQVREEVRVLLYGNQLAVGGGASADGGGALPESLLHWLSQQYVSGADLQEALSSLELRVLQNISQQLETQRGEEAAREAVLHAAATGGAVTQEDVHVIVQNALRLFSEDRTGRADYALESGGGSILSTRCSETYETKAALLSLFGLPLWFFSQSPRAVIQPDVHPGNCWAFRGSSGFLVIRLSMRVLPTAFSLEHIPKTLAPSGALHSAPRHFSVYGLDDDSQEKGKLLGTFTYDEDGEALQTFSVTEENERAFQIIEVQVLSNWGHQEYTCMYRFRVHGTPEEV